jgi:RNA 2',3'-cyclic 3'-phosphodiesterase
MRLFIGIPLSGETAGELAAPLARLRSGAGRSRWPTLRWTRPESWHITLQFLGNTTPEQLQCLTGRLGEVGSAPVPVQIGELGVFDRAGVFFADVVVSPGLAALKERVAAATGLCGFAAETRPFHPHITLARKAGNEGPREQGSKNAQSGTRSLRELMAQAGGCKFSRFTAREFLLYESHLSSQGSRYEVRARFPLEEL